MKSSYEKVYKKCIHGIKKVNDLVSPTMGALGRSVVIEMPDGNPMIINDGINIAERINLEDKKERSLNCHQLY